jgi:tRNA uridine 5-carboxymethylaminomethyl modification enzyme
LSLRADNSDQRLTPLGIKINLVTKFRKSSFIDKQKKLVSVYNALQSNSITPNAAAKYSVKIAMDGVKRSGIEVLALKDVTIKKLRKIWDNIPYYDHHIDEQVETDAHYSGYLKRQSHDIKAFKKDESIVIPSDIEYDNFSGLSMEIRTKLKLIRPKTLGQALRIDGVTPAAAIILLVFIKKNRYKLTA